MESVGPPASGHKPAGELIHDDHFSVFDDIITVALENDLGFERLLQVVDMAHAAFVVDILHAEDFFHLLDAGFGQRNRFFFDVEIVILVLFKLGRDRRECLIQLAGIFVRRGDDQRRACFVD